MTLVRHPVDGRVHISELKEMRRSPAHYKYACESAREVTRPMRVGFVTDRLIFGGAGYEVADTDSRASREWKAAVKACPPGVMLVTSPEYDDASGAANAVLADPVARAALTGCQFQRVLQWTAHGLDWASGVEGVRGGLDAWKDDLILDLKTTASADPDELARHVLRMGWHAQGAAYIDGAQYNGIPATRFALICVEAQPPHVVTVLRLPPAILDLGRRALRLWTERLRACDKTGEFPGYVQCEVDCEVPEWAFGAASEATGDHE
jgi:hypothetical protein